MPEHKATAIGSPRYNSAQAEATKTTSAKSAAAAIVITMASDVALATPAGFAAASKKAADLARRYGELSGNRLP